MEREANYTVVGAFVLLVVGMATAVAMPTTSSTNAPTTV